MKKRMLMLALALFMMLGVISNTTVYAQSYEKPNLIELTDKYVVCENGEFHLVNAKQLEKRISYDIELYREELNGNNIKQYLELLETRLESLNELSYNNQIMINDSGQIIDLSTQTYSTRSSNMRSETYWWGRKHIFYTDAAARDYAYDVRMSAHANAGAAVIAGAVFGGVGAIPNGLTAAWAYSVADTVDYNANKPGKGVVLEARWILTYKCYPR
ncbi:hypothetical protein [Clostridium sp.]|uniref:hypothetical protein n=1 Tax=Clostridium sp. TaxID=1506 RepID=UPI0026DB7AA4|nr:hypothetical protein [Clostridium sp.]MDO5040226.1 hypothetical protein [Clostridium sp.]